VVLAICGSMLGCLVLYLIGYAGGEVVLERRMSPEKFHKISRDFDRNAFLTIAVPALLPPPFPFKIFVLAAGAFEISWRHFLLAILVGRAVRYSVLAVLTLTVGPQVLTIFGSLLRQHPLESLGVVVAAVLLALALHRSRLKLPSTQAPAGVSLKPSEQRPAD
jgi:uncharacterized membrane protein YdjX (TVP38/TMEM64 family)